jgi:subtilisin family serine protease
MLDCLLDIKAPFKPSNSSANPMSYRLIPVGWRDNVEASGMSITEIKVPDIGDFENAEVTELMVKPGDRIAVAQPVVLIETDKATIEIPSSHAGIVKELKIKLGDKLSEGSLMLILEEDAPEKNPRVSPSVQKFARELGVDLSKVAGSGAKGQVTRHDVQAFIKELVNGTSRHASEDGGRMRRLSENIARTTVPPQLTDAAKRLKWDMPPLTRPEDLGPYIVELNGEHLGGLPGAAVAFMKLYVEEVKKDLHRRPPLRLSKSYYRCDFSDREWHHIVALDEANTHGQRSIYRLWPDFPVEVRTDRSVSTIKADAALRSFDAAGENIVWAVIDSGIDARHSHFRSVAPGEPEDHRLLCAEVAGLHRCFADVYMQDNGIDVVKTLADPDLSPSDLSEAERNTLVQEHKKWALQDDYGHGTHVAGIIAGQSPDAARVCALERQHKVDEVKVPVSQTFIQRKIIPSSNGSAPGLRGVAPRCRLISLRVLDKDGKGRTSQIIQALEYVREKINDNPKLMRVHGVNLSVGYEFDAEMFACGQSPLCNAVDRLVQEGVVVVTAAGNTGFGMVAASVGSAKVGLSNTINDPGNAALAITVGATHRDAPHTYGVSYFSSKGPTADGRLKPDLVAPGERITSCAAGAKLRNALQTIHLQEDENLAYYMDDSGTSMAAPHVSGAIAAFLSVRREFIGKPLEVKRIFLESATSLGRERYFEGCGMVDLMRAIQLV